MNNKLSNHFTFLKVIPISLNGRIGNSSQIIEGELTAKQIYTANEINVYKVHVEI